jgi:hypothetical protein
MRGRLACHRQGFVNGTMAHHGCQRPGGDRQTASCPGIRLKNGLLHAIIEIEQPKISLLVGIIEFINKNRICFVYLDQIVLYLSLITIKVPRRLVHFYLANIRIATLATDYYIFSSVKIIRKSSPNILLAKLISSAGILFW